MPAQVTEPPLSVSLVEAMADSQAVFEAVEIGCRISRESILRRLQSAMLGVRQGAILVAWQNNRITMYDAARTLGVDVEGLYALLDEARELGVLAAEAMDEAGGTT